MVSHQQSLHRHHHHHHHHHHHRRHVLIFVGRSPFLRIIFHGKKNSFWLRQQRSNISKKQHKLMLRPCSVKRPSYAKEKQSFVREVLTGQEKKEKILTTEDETNIKEVLHELPGILTTPSNNRTKSGIIFIFERASLVPALVGKTYQILNPDDHANFLRRHKKNPYDYRPEIIHQALLEVADSKLYKTGRVQAIYVKTDEGLLIKIEPHVLIPRTFRRFCSMMLELLQKFSVKAVGKREKLLRLIANPVTQHLPANCYKIGLSYSSEKRVRLKDYVGALNNDVNLVFVVGAMAHGKINCDYTDEIVSVSEFPLSAACCVRRISCAIEKNWKIL